MDEKQKQFVQEIVAETIRQLKKDGLLRDPAAVAYREAGSILRKYYKNGEDDPAVKKAVDRLRDDPYFKIIPLYYGYHYTIEDLAEVYEVEISTISRNKKRLSLAGYNSIE